MRFFVYELVDPRSDTAFYVGKGQGRRPHCHMHEARSGKPGDKCDVIREIEGLGLTVEIRKLKHFASSDEAFAFERAYIASYGLDNLTNISGGITGFRRKVAAMGGWTNKAIDDVIRQARLYLSKTENHRLRFVCLGYDVTDAMNKYFTDIIADIGKDRFLARARGAA